MKLAGTTFIRNGIEFDYHFKETIYSLLEATGHVFVVDAGSDDGTLEEIVFEFGGNERVSMIALKPEEWFAQTGKEKLSYFTNIAVHAAREAGYDYHFYLQCDEIVHERSYKAIREAITTGHEGFMVHRINLWGSPYRYLDVEQSRKPCSTEICRLAKTNYIAVDDAENIGVGNVSFDYLNQIEIYHMGFVRDIKVMKDKIHNMQVNVFGMAEHDSKLDLCDTFNPWLWFDKEEDTKIIEKPLPMLIREWAAERAKGYK